MKKQHLFGFALFILLCYFPLFLHLDSLSLRLWDESRRGVNALEMTTEGHWLVPHFEGHPDNYGTKPPLLIWLQAISMKVLGINELAVRLPSALAGLATVLLLWLFAFQVLKKPLVGYFSGLILLTSQLYIDKHGAITGDYDALLTLFQTIYLIAFYLYLTKQKVRYLYLTGLGVLLAGWTKGIAGLFFLPGLLAYIFLDKKVGFIFRSRQVYLTGLTTLLGILSYYIIRESLYPGYLETVWGNELGGRFFEAREGYQRSFWFYLGFLFRNEGFYPWLFLLPLGFFIGLSDNQIRRFSQLVLINSILFFLIISTSKTKFEWYILPLLPIWSVLVAIGLENLYSGAVSKLNLAGWKKQAFLLLFLIAFFAFPYWKVIKKVYVFEHQGYEVEKVLYADFMKRNEAVKAYTILHPGYNGHIVFYKKLYNLEGYSIRQKILQKPRPQVQVIDNDHELTAGEWVMVCESAADQYLLANYHVETVSDWKKCRMYKINGEK